MPKRSRPDSLPPSPSASPFSDDWSSSPAVSPAAEPEHSAKYAQLDAEAAGDDQRDVMRCQLPPHPPLSFPSFEAYENHYRASHVNRCAECHRNFPTEHYLGLHIAENHDPLNEARRERGERTYQCFVEDCERFCSTPQKRKMHMIDKHRFPKFYDFFIVNDGIDKRTSMLRPGHHRRRSSTAAASKAASGEQRARRRGGSDAVTSTHDGSKPGESISPTARDSTNSTSPTLTGGPPRQAESPRADAEAPQRDDTDMDDIARDMAALRFVPPKVRFGRGRGGGGLARS